MIEINPVSRGTGLVIAHGTVWKDGRIRWGLAMEGLDSCGIRGILQPCVDDKNKRQWRVSIQFARRVQPLWWGTKHKLAVMAEVRERRFDFQLAADSKLANTIEGTITEPGHGQSV